MSSYTIRPTGRQLDDVTKVSALGPSTIQSIARALNNNGAIIEPDKIEKAIAAVPGVGADTAKVVRRVLIGFATASRRTFTEISDVLDGAVTPFPPSWDAETRQQWIDCRPAIEELLLSKPVTLTAKAIDLSVDFERLFLSCRIVTDARPVFNADRSEIAGASVIHTLRIDYMNASGDESTISIAIDTKDIEQLENECDKAMRKANITRALMEKADVPTLLMGEESDG
jgi:hypothetical protein